MIDLTITCADCDKTISHTDACVHCEKCFEKNEVERTAFLDTLQSLVDARSMNAIYDLQAKAIELLKGAGR